MEIGTATAVAAPLPVSSGPNGLPLDDRSGSRQVAEGRPGGGRGLDLVVTAPAVCCSERAVRDKAENRHYDQSLANQAYDSEGEQDEHRASQNEGRDERCLTRHAASLRRSGGLLQHDLLR